MTEKNKQNYWTKDAEYQYLGNKGKESDMSRKMTHQMHDRATGWVWLSQKLWWRLSKAANLILDSLKCEDFFLTVVSFHDILHEHNIEESSSLSS